MDDAQACPCGSAKNYGGCCAPFHRREREPDTAEKLMRSRYSAFALKQVDHLARTLHSTHSDAKRSSEELRRDLKKVCNRTEYLRLAILETTSPDAKGAATVTFRVELKDRGREASFTEKSTFLVENGGWRYVSGVPA